MKVPVVLPVVYIDVAADGRLTVTLDGDVYEPGGVFTRSNVGDVLDQITTKLDSPVRVEVREADGTTYADIATPPERAAAASEDQPVGPEAPATCNAGFQPGEEVALAYVLTRLTADAYGNTPLRLPPALLASCRDGLVLVGLTSHTIANMQ